MFPLDLSLTDLGGQSGLIINGAAPSERIGWAVKFVGDLNGDRIDDIAISAPQANSGGLAKAGKVYIIFGRRGGWSQNLNLSTLKGSDGVVLSGLGTGDGLGWSVSGAGDLNGDGVDDLLVGAPFAEVAGKSNTGQAYVIFGRRGSHGLGALNLATLNGRNGFTILGRSASGQLGYAVSKAGDLNGDGLGDILVGAPLSRSPYGKKSGQVYVIFGQRSGFQAIFDWAKLNPKKGLSFWGGTAGEQAGFAVTHTGDLNGDGVTDVMIGAPFATVRGPNSGRSYVVFGKRNGFGDHIDLSLLDGRTGFVLNGVFAEGQSGYAVSAAGDVNGDRIADVIIGAPFANPNGMYSGQSYVVLGRRNGFSSVLDLGSLNGLNGWAINGVVGRSGFSVSGLGDVNGDRLGDIAIGAPLPSVGGNSPGQGYILFGRTPTQSASTLSIGQLKADMGVKLKGRLPDESVGYSVGGMGDLNGDHLMDILISAPLASPNGVSRAGQVYVVFGQSQKPAPGITPTTSVLQGATVQGGATLVVPPIPLPAPHVPTVKSQTPLTPLQHLER